MENDEKLNNFRKINFKHKDIEYELGISIYSKLIFVIFTDTCKLGNMYIGELEEEDMDETEFMDVKCILGDRSNEESQFLANFIINYIFTGLKQTDNTKIQKVLVSSSLKKNSFSNKDGLTSGYKDLIGLVKENVTTLLNI